MQGALGGGQLIALVRRPTAACFVETPLGLVLPPFALVLELLALVRAVLALVGRQFTHIREVIALIGDDVATIRRCAGISCGRGLDRDGSLGGATRLVGLMLMQPNGLLVPVQRLAMQLGRLPVQLAHAGVGCLGHQVLAALSGCPLAANLLAGLVAQPLRAASLLTMLLELCEGHG
jgi:hypothetical protein